MIRCPLLVFAVFAAIVVASEPAKADGCGQRTSSGRIVCLATRTAVSESQMFTTPSLGFPKDVTVCLSSVYPTTFVVSASLDGSTFFNERFMSPLLADPNQVASFSVGTPGQCVQVIPAQYIRVTVQLPATVTIHVMASN